MLPRDGTFLVVLCYYYKEANVSVAGTHGCFPDNKETVINEQNLLLEVRGLT